VFVGSPSLPEFDTRSGSLAKKDSTFTHMEQEQWFDYLVQPLTSQTYIHSVRHMTLYTKSSGQKILNCKFYCSAQRLVNYTLLIILCIDTHKMAC
jgi:hypothetical protein